MAKRRKTSPKRRISRSRNSKTSITEPLIGAAMVVGVLAFAPKVLPTVKPFILAAGAAAAGFFAMTSGKSAQMKQVGGAVLAASLPFVVIGAAPTLVPSYTATGVAGLGDSFDDIYMNSTEDQIGDENTIGGEDDETY